MNAFYGNAAEDDSAGEKPVETGPHGEVDAETEKDLEEAFSGGCEAGGVVAGGEDLKTEKGNADNANDADADREDINYVHREITGGAAAEVGAIDEASFNVATIGENASG